MQQTTPAQPPVYQRFRSVIIAGILIGAAIVITTIFRLLTPPVVEQDQVVRSNQQLATQYTFSYGAVSIPDEILVYQTSAINYSPRVLATQIAAVFSLEPSADFDNYWNNETNGTQLYLNPNQELELKSTRQLTPHDEATTGTASPELAAYTAQEMVDQLNLYSDTAFSLSEPKPWISSDGQNTAADPQNPIAFNVFRFTLSQQLNGYPVYNSSETKPPAILYINRDGSFNRALFYPQPSAFTEVDDFSTRTLAELESIIQNNDAIVLEVLSADMAAPFLSVEDLVEVDLSSAEIQYRINDDGATLPYMFFRGFGRSEENFSYEVQLIVPLVPVSE